MEQSVLERLISAGEKQDSPERRAILEQFGEEYYADALYLNLLREGIIEALENSGAGINQNNKNRFQSYLYFNGNADPLTEAQVAQIMNNSGMVNFAETDVPFVIVSCLGVTPAVKHIYAFKNGKGNYGGFGSSVTAAMLQYINTLNATDSDLENASNTVTINLGNISGSFITVLNSIERDFSDNSLIYILLFSSDGTSYSKHFVGTTYGKYGGSNVLRFTEAMWEDNGTGETPAPALPTLKQITNTSGGLTNQPLTVETLQHGISQGKTIYASGSLTRFDSNNRKSIVQWEPLQVNEIQLTIPAKLSNDTFAMVSDVAAVYDQIVAGAPTDYNTLNKIATKLSAVISLVGSSSADTDTIVNTVAEILAVFQNYPEGLNLLTALAGKVNTSDIINNLNQVVAGKVLDAAQGKVLKDLLDTVTTNAIVSGSDSTMTVKSLSLVGSYPSSPVANRLYFVETAEYFGTVTVNASGTTTIRIPHLQNFIPSWFMVENVSANAAGIISRDADATYITVTYASVPAASGAVMTYNIGLKK